ncbi:MBL fold metallo-hydrolase [Mucilaginibacter limnophilus]|uniref:MBL fold metallo-hydrolase n=1 Tax=Mucilaginibacter limnophilus TaxID=1932778 RepID=A0A3S2XZD6_9SPHI|nr:MBL fold metallo-hydrolase [Mucilaginibacter limnophilus]RVT99777.1 MBL fold metallo-hydrolase [Mucilaginibacter limnophilus]
MSLFIASLNSGSNGNCYYVGNSNEAVLIDVGISCREVERRMARIGLSMNKVKAIFISHEHSDHISGVAVLCRKYKLPVYITPATMLHGRLMLDCVVNFADHVPITIGDLVITPFSKLHDAAHPHSFTVACNGITIGVFTDLGAPCDNLVRYFKQCHAAFLEANYDEQMLASGRYPYFLKRRISGGKGHLSNTQALRLFLDHRPSFMSHLLLAHLSKDNNCPDLVHQLFTQHAGNTQIVVASRFKETQVYKVSGKAPVEHIAIPNDELARQYLLF